MGMDWEREDFVNNDLCGWILGYGKGGDVNVDQGNYGFDSVVVVSVGFVGSDVNDIDNDLGNDYDGVIKDENGLMIEFFNNVERDWGVVYVDESGNKLD